MEMSFKEEETHLVATCRGEWTAPEMTRLIIQMRDKAKQTSHSRILVDCCSVSAPPSEFHRYLAGKDVATFLRRPFKVSVLYMEALINHFGEDVAVNRGADIRVFPTEQGALKWLLAGISKTANAGDV